MSSGHEQGSGAPTSTGASNDAVDELTPDVFLCVNCGAQVSFERSYTATDEDEDDGDATPLERATCTYCDVVNDRALAIMRKQAAARRHDERVKTTRRRSLLVWCGAAFGAVLILFGIAASQKHGELRDVYRDVERTRAQVDNVTERRSVVRRQWEPAPPSPDRDAELSGAENRVRIERKRYDEAAARYNEAVGSWWASLCASLFGMPERAPLSNEASW